MSNDTLAFAVLYVFGLVLATVVHEGGHLAMGALLRCSPRVLCIGVGRHYASLRCAGIWIVLRLVPIGGYVLLLPRSRERRFASFLVTAAGPCANLIAGLVFWGGSDLLPDILPFAFGAPQALFLLASLIPRTAKINSFPIFTDGKKLLLFLLGRDRDVLSEAYARVVAELRPDSDAPERTDAFAEIVLQTSRSDRLEPWGRRQAIDALALLMESGDLNAMEAELTKQVIYEFVDADQAAFREERRLSSRDRRRT